MKLWVLGEAPFLLLLWPYLFLPEANSLCLCALSLDLNVPLRSGSS